MQLQRQVGLGVGVRWGGQMQVQTHAGWGVGCGERTPTLLSGAGGRGRGEGGEGGREPPEADLKEAMAAAPCRTRVVREHDADAAAAVSGAGDCVRRGVEGKGVGEGRVCGGDRAPPEADLMRAPAAAPCRTQVVW